MNDVFARYRRAAYPYEFHGQLAVRSIAGGIPSDPNVAEAFLKTKLADSDDLIRARVAEMMVERQVDAEEASDLVANLKYLNGFKRDESGLYYEGRQLKAAIKEATAEAVASGKLKQTGWGVTRKYLTNYLKDHVFVLEEKLPLGISVEEFSAEVAKNGDGRAGIRQTFVHTRRSDSIKYEEYIENCQIEFTVVTDHNFSEKEWALIWLTGEQLGIGASRSQGLGRYTVTKWEGGRKGLKR